jgi:phosphate transport system substrate-binding protein
LNLKRTIGSAALVLAGSAIVATGAAQAATPTTISEAGSTLVFPLAQEWADNYNIITGNTVNTAVGGSGLGITDVCSNQIQIGASDAPLGFPGVKECGTGTPTGTLTTPMSTMAQYVEVPWALSGTGLLYDLPGIKTGVHLSLTDLAKIYTGKITNWDQLQSQQYKTVTKTVTKKVHGKKKKVKEKKKVRLFKLPNLKITPVFRSDGSGDSYAFTNALTKGAGKSWSFGPSTSFPTSAGPGLGASGNAGVTAQVEATKGAIGYVSVYYLIAAVNNDKNDHVAAIENAAGNFEIPSATSIKDASSSISKPPAQNVASATKPFGLLIQYPSKKFSGAYPISTYTYAIVPRAAGSNAAADKSFLDYAVSTKFEGSPGGVNTGVAIGFVPIPSAVQSYDKSVINDIN